MTVRKARSPGEIRFLLTVAAVCAAVVAGQILIAGYAMFVRCNFREVVRGKVYRSAQPSVEELRRWVKNRGIKTIVNLRGYNLDEFHQRDREEGLARELGIAYVWLPLNVHARLPADDHKELIRIIETAELPILLHCYRGVDRAGTASAMAAMAIGKRSFEEAKCQAYVAPGPWKRSREGDYAHISDVLALYEQHCRESGLDTGGWDQFKRWAAAR